jgi:hypothetical protein
MADNKDVKSSIITHILEALKTGPTTSSQLYAALAGLGYKGNLARTNVSRMVAGGRLHRYALKLAHGNSLLSLEKPEPDPDVLRTLHTNNFYGRQTLRNLVDCLRTSHPSVTRDDVARMAAVEIGDSRQLQPDWALVAKVLEGFEEIGILEAGQSEGTEPTWVFNKPLFLAAHLGVGTINVTPAHMALRRRVKFRLAEAMGAWLRENALVSDSGTTTASQGRPANYLSLPFDLVGFSFLTGLAGRDKNGAVPRAVVGDCLLEECNLPYARSFAARVEQCAAKNGAWPFAFVISERFEHSAFMYLKKSGVATWTQSQLLGKKTSEAIQRVLAIAEDLIQQREIDPGAFAEIFEGLDSFSGPFGNLKGTLFELLIAYLFHRRTGNSRLAWEIKDDHHTYDVDVFASHNTQAYAVECKGIKADAVVSNGDVQRHFRYRLPLARHLAFAERINPIRQIQGIVITTGSFEPQSQEDVGAGAYGNQQHTQFELWDRPRLLKELV